MMIHLQIRDAGARGKMVADLFTLIKHEGQIKPTTLLVAPLPRFSDLKTALLITNLVQTWYRKGINIFSMTFIF